MEQEINPLQQQTDIPISADEIYAANLQEERIKNLIEQISPDNQILDLQWRIKGYVKNPLTQQYEKIDENAPEPSPLLISRYISYLSSIMNQNTTFSNYSSQEINKIMGLVIKWLKDDLTINADKYGLKDDYTERTRIGHIILNETFSAFKRAQNGMESKRIFSSLSMTETSNPYNQNKKSFMDALKFWK